MKRKAPPTSPAPATNWLRWIGIVLLILSFAFYASLLLLPFLTLAGTTKAAAVTVLIVLAEVAFWIGGIILGKEFVTRYRRFLDPRNWRKK